MFKFIIPMLLAFAYLMDLVVIVVGAWFVWIAVHESGGSGLDISRLALAGMIVLIGVAFGFGLFYICGTPMSRYREACFRGFPKVVRK